MMRLPSDHVTWLAYPEKVNEAGNSSCLTSKNITEEEDNHEAEI
jgi:hypothetical protein